MPANFNSKPKPKDRSSLRLLHLVWEPPTRVVGGMGIAVANLCRSLEKHTNVGVTVMSPSAQVGQDITNVSSYDLGINQDEALQIQDGVDQLQGLTGVDGVVAQFIREVDIALRSGMHGEVPRYSVVHAHDWMTAAAGVCVKRTHGVPLILHIHSTQFDREGAQSQGALFSHEKWAMEQADVIVAVSHYTKNIITEFYGIRADKVRVVWNASSSFSGERGSVFVNSYSSMGAVSDSSLVLFAGRLVDQKYPELAIEIMVRALKRVPSARGVIAGGGDKLESIRKLIDFKGMRDRIEVLGSVPQENMATLYRAASVLLVPSLSEPFGLVALEAARGGAAVMLSDRCGVSEILKSAKVTELRDLDGWVDGVVKFLKSPELCDEQVKNQNEDLKDYSWDAASAEVLSVVRELLQR